MSKPPRSNYFSRTKETFVGTKRLYKKYWSVYGGVSAVAESTYFLAAVVLTIISSGIWTKPDWWFLPIGVLPNLIGFTLGGYAILLAFGDRDFLKKLTEIKSSEMTGEPVEGKLNPSAFLTISSTFMHFLLIEIVALILAIVAMSRPFSSLHLLLSHFSFVLPYLHVLPYQQISIARQVIAYFSWFVSFLTFVYAICLSLASTAAVFRVAGWFVSSQPSKP